jgi:protoheme IX farnesyltransferase
MPTGTATAAAAPAHEIRAPLAVLRDVLQLAKPRLSGLVLLTTTGGMALAPGEIGLARALLTVFATAAVVGAANALNCYLERDSDALMRRTRERPLPAGRLDPLVALGGGLVVPVLALPLLALSAGRLTAALALVALVSYVAIYTPMKRRSTMALVVGAVPGAIPPLMGWTAVTGGLDAGGLALFGLLFAWQLPHFLAISIYLKEDYARGGMKVFAVVHGEPLTRRWIALTSLALPPAALLPVWLGLAGWGYGAVALGASLAFCALAIAGVGPRGESPRYARQVFLATLLYLVVLMLALFAGARA